MSPVTASSIWRVGSTCGVQSPARQPIPRSQRPAGTSAAAPRIRSSASSTLAAPSRRTCRCPIAHVGKCTCESLKPGTTQRPPRSTTSGEASDVSCVPTPPAISSPAIARARDVGSEGSSVRTIPFSRIMRQNLAVSMGKLTSWRVEGAYLESCNCEAICPVSHDRRRSRRPLDVRRVLRPARVARGERRRGRRRPQRVSTSRSRAATTTTSPARRGRSCSTSTRAGDDAQRSALETIFLGDGGGEHILKLPWVRKPRVLLDVRPSRIEFGGDFVRVEERASIRASVAVPGRSAGELCG